MMHTKITTDRRRKVPTTIPTINHSDTKMSDAFDSDSVIPARSVMGAVAVWLALCVMDALRVRLELCVWLIVVVWVTLGVPVLLRL